MDSNMDERDKIDSWAIIPKILTVLTKWTKEDWQEAFTTFPEVEARILSSFSSFDNSQEVTTEQLNEIINAWKEVPESIGITDREQLEKFHRALRASKGSIVTSIAQELIHRRAKEKKNG